MNEGNVEKTKSRAIIMSAVAVCRKNSGEGRTALEKGCISKNALGAVVIEGDIMMRTILIAGIAAAGIGLAATSGASAAPVNGAVIGDLATATDHVTPVQWGGHWRWGSRGGHWRWGSSGGGHWRWGSRGFGGGHWRWGSRGFRRW